MAATARLVAEEGGGEGLEELAAPRAAAGPGYGVRARLRLVAGEAAEARASQEAGAADRGAGQAGLRGGE